MLPGASEITTTIIDPITTFSNGVSKFSNTTGANTADYQITSGSAVQDLGKSAALGDMEMILPIWR